MSGPTPLLLTFYGDDFTGSTDVMEVLTLGAVRTVLFLEPPSVEAIAALEGVEAIGVAGTSRSMTPREMEEALPPVFDRLLELGAPVLHYKTCSTFDSSPTLGSIGRALEIGLERAGDRFVPLVVGAPRLGRYCAFGNLFARSGSVSEVFRLDRHPTMRRHPVTPMAESDLRRHLACQTNARVALFDLPRYAGTPEETDVRLQHLLEAEGRVVLFDVVSEEQLPAIGRLIWRRAAEAPVFAVGSSGVESALTAHWIATGARPSRTLPVAGATDRLIVVSGSCSPVTGRQIDHAVAHGFEEIPIDPSHLEEDRSAGAARADVEARARAALEEGRSVVLHTARGPHDPRIRSALQGRVGAGPVSAEERARLGKRLGAELGSILRRLVESTGVRRVVVAGGDTSGVVAQALRIVALEIAATLAPGAPLCRAHAPGTPLHGLEIAFKGGQVGGDGFFSSARAGNP